nr:alpha-1,2-fucosyltransferase [Sporomusa silvacetica]
MFQYACGRALALRTGRHLYLDLSNASVNNFRRYELDKMNINATPIHSLRELNEIKARLGIQSIPVFKERHYNFDPNVIDFCDNVFLSNGYWQSEKYFLDFASVIRKELTPKLHNLSADSFNIAQEMKNHTSIAIHVRRGDYLKSLLHGILPMDYYQQAIRYFTIRFPSIRFYVFSDDVNWCNHDFIALFPNTHVVKPALEEGSWRDLWLMSQCQHNIIANSTYSWWGAWLNDNPQKIIIAPEPMFAGLQSPDLIPTLWIRIPVRFDLERGQ